MPHGPEKPTGRHGHVMATICSPLTGSQQTLLLMSGGYNSSDCWLLSFRDNASWSEVQMNNKYMYISLYAHMYCKHTCGDAAPA